MVVIDALKFNRELLERMRSVGVRMDDVRYIDLYADVKSMTAAGDKKTYAVAVAADRYNVSERLVYDIVKRFDAPLQI